MRKAQRTGVTGHQADFKRNVTEACRVGTEARYESWRQNSVQFVMSSDRFLKALTMIRSQDNLSVSDEAWKLGVMVTNLPRS